MSSPRAETERISGRFPSEEGEDRSTDSGILAPAMATRGMRESLRNGSGGRRVVLVVEDCAEKRDLITWAFDECRNQVDLRFVFDGGEALEYLLREGRYRDPDASPRPSLVLLGLHHPKVDGLEVIRTVRRDRWVRAIPIVVLSGVDEDRGVLRAYEAGANSFIEKPSSMEGYHSVIRVLESYWLRRVELPDGL
jgi:CheY-like chemotaxis protein